MRGTRLPRHYRIRRGSEIRTVLRKGQRERTRHFDLYRADAPGPHSRFGLIVPKHRHKIVDRNLLKRRIREVGRTRLLPMLAASGETTDLLVRARAGAYDLSYAQIAGELERAMGTAEGNRS